jgi:hypothetical protein
MGEGWDARMQVQGAGRLPAFPEEPEAVIPTMTLNPICDWLLWIWWGGGLRTFTSD